MSSVTVTLDKAIKFFWSVAWRSALIGMVLLAVFYALVFMIIRIYDSLGIFATTMREILTTPLPILGNYTIRHIISTAVLDAIHIAIAVLVAIYIAIFSIYTATRMTIKSCSYTTFVFDKNISKTTILKYSIFFVILIPLASTLLNTLLIQAASFFNIGIPSFLLTSTEIIMLVWYNKMVMSRKFLGVFLPIHPK